jgi:hypothetical protein
LTAAAGIGKCTVKVTTAALVQVMQQHHIKTDAEIALIQRAAGCINIV